MPASEEWSARASDEAVTVKNRGMVKSSLIVLCLCATAALGTGLFWRGAGRAPPLQSAIATGPVARPAAPAPLPAVKRVANSITYRVDRSGHYFVDAAVNGIAVRFLVDTGATSVALAPRDAAAIGLPRSSLRFTGESSTANGTARVAPVTLREIRVDQFPMQDVAAVVMEQPMEYSLLGMSYLGRLYGYSIRDGVLTLEW
jgi:aspartyl protease family protein